jgi:hypothetical protein
MDGLNHEALLRGRKQERTRLIYHLRVFDARKHRLLGHMTDITPQGMMLIGEKPVRVGREFSLRMDLPRNVMEGRPLVFPAQSMWCRRDGGEEFYSMGFRILDLEPSARDVISALIRDFYREDIDEGEPGVEMNPEL